MVPKLALVVGMVAASLGSSGCCFTLGGEPSYFVYPDTFGPRGTTVLMWPADEEAHRFRYLVTGSWGELSAERVVREVGLVPDRSFERYVPEDARGVIVLLPADRLDALRPRARLLLDHVTALRPALSTSVTPVTDELLERPIATIADAEELDASVARAVSLHRMERPSTFGDAFAALRWTPGMLVMPLEPDDAEAVEPRFALIRVFDLISDEPPREERIVDWSGLIAAVEEVRSRREPPLVAAWILESPDASDAVRAQVERLMDWIGALEGDLLVWQRATLREELPADADDQRILEWVFGALRREGALAGPIEVRLRYDPERFAPSFMGRLVER